MLNEQLPRSGTVFTVRISLGFLLYVWKYLVIWHGEILLEGKYHIQFSNTHNIFYSQDQSEQPTIPEHM